jgi:hypothetical protein
MLIHEEAGRWLVNSLLGLRSSMKKQGVTGEELPRSTIAPIHEEAGEWQVKELLGLQ